MTNRAAHASALLTRRFGRFAAGLLAAAVTGCYTPQEQAGPEPTHEPKTKSETETETETETVIVVSESAPPLSDAKAAIAESLGLDPHVIAEGKTLTLGYIFLRLRDDPWGNLREIDGEFAPLVTIPYKAGRVMPAR